MNSFFHRIGHVVATIGKDAAKVAEVAAPLVLPIAAPVVAPILPLVAPLFKIHNQEFDPMNPLEAMAISMMLGMLQSVVKNPAHAAALKQQMVGIAVDIFLAYGMMPPQAAMQTVVAAPAPASAPAEHV